MRKKFDDVFYNTDYSTMIVQSESLTPWSGWLLTMKREVLLIPLSPDEAGKVAKALMSGKVHIQSPLS